LAHVGYAVAVRKRKAALRSSVFCDGRMMVAGDCDDGVRQAIAITIIELAKAGERKPDLSCEGVVENFRERVQRSG
jgi:hypothetical protein